MSALDKFYDFTLNLPDAKLTSKAMSLCNIDRNVFNIYLTLQEGKNNPILNADLGNYTVTMIVVKPKTKEYVEKVGVVDGSNDRLLFELGDTFNDQIGSYKGEIKVQNGNEVITSSSFAYTVTQSLISGLNAEIEASPDVEILRQLINEVKAVVGMTPGDPDSLLTDYQKKNDNTLITTDKTIIGAINENSSQIKEKANLNSVFSMANMGQDVKEAMTGGSVAVVGVNTILEENIVKGQITPPTTSFLKNCGNLVDNSNFKITKGKYLNGNTGEITNATGDNYVVVENFIPVIVGKTYVFNSAVGWLFCYDSAENFINRVATTDCSSTWKRATIPEGTVYVRFFCDKSNNSYTKIYLFEYDSSLIYGINIPTEDKLPQTNYFIENFRLEDETLSTIKEEIKNNITDSVIYKMIKDYSELIFNGCKVKLIGDSITAGQGGTNFNSNFNTSGGELITDKIWQKSWYTNDTGTCWANSLKDYLTQKFGCTVKNYGCPGIGVDQMILAIDDLVRNEDELVICMIGTNNRHNMQLTEFYSKLKQIYEIITVTKGKKCIMMSCMPASVENELSSNRIFHTEDIDNMYFKLSCEKNVEYISIYKEVMKYCDTKGIDVDTLLNSDGLHPNDNGYNVMFKIVCNALGFAQKRDGATW